jgi:hypothetical protein
LRDHLQYQGRILLAILINQAKNFKKLILQFSNIEFDLIDLEEVHGFMQLQTYPSISLALLTNFIGRFELHTVC